tara:strand:- start:126 stop:281 length:156 start_codon:yes stop_codon:yes gene_type:complete
MNRKEAKAEARAITEDRLRVMDEAMHRRLMQQAERAREYEDVVSGGSYIRV